MCRSQPLPLTVLPSPLAICKDSCAGASVLAAKSVFASVAALVSGYSRTISRSLSSATNSDFRGSCFVNLSFSAAFPSSVSMWMGIGLLIVRRVRRVEEYDGRVEEYEGRVEE